GCVTAPSLPPRALGALLARAGVYVGNDSGASHLAAAWGARTVALFGPTDPAIWSPVGASVTIVRSPTGRMQDIPLTSVLDAIRQQLPFAGRRKRRIRVISASSKPQGPP